ncbi:hypothetical protein HYC85_012134 [Camellia sinensis]|uniref:Uncharacterized protein n=1 Tax=Camellia sinensis TaxID=4442 RepID=A0A7J7HD46_CAMSI|nr:hypothetical protein HYC85_012134 [Camellia sinensis]
MTPLAAGTHCHALSRAATRFHTPSAQYTGLDARQPGCPLARRPHHAGTPCAKPLAGPFSEPRAEPASEPPAGPRAEPRHFSPPTWLLKLRLSDDDVSRQDWLTHTSNRPWRLGTSKDETSEGKGLMFCYFGMLPAVMYDSALRDITGKAVMETILEMVRRDNKTPDVFILMQVMRCYLHSGDIDRSLKIFEEYMKLVREASYGGTICGIGEVSGTHPPASSRLCFQVIKRRRYIPKGMQLALETLENMTSRDFFFSPKMGNDLLLVAAGEKVVFQKKKALISCDAMYSNLFLLSLIGWSVYLRFTYLLQTGGYTMANYVWDLMQARKIIPSPPAVEAYYNGLKVSLLALLINLFYFNLVNFQFVIYRKRKHRSQDFQFSQMLPYPQSGDLSGKSLSLNMSK